MAARLKLLGAFMVFICLTSVGLPGLNGFVGEMLVLAGVYDLHGATVSGYGFAVVLAIGIVLGAWYLLTMLHARVLRPAEGTGPRTGHPVGDLNGRELATIVPVMGLCLLLGVWPQPVLDAIAGGHRRGRPDRGPGETRGRRKQRMRRPERVHGRLTAMSCQID